MRRAWEAWDRFLFAPRTARVLGLYRIVFGLIVLYSFSLLAKDAVVFFSDEGLLSDAGAARSFGPNYLTLFHWLRSAAAVRAALALLFVAAACFTVGFHTRAAAATLYVLVVSFHARNIYVLQGADAVIRTLLFFFVFAPAGTAFSVDRLRLRLRDPGAPEPRLAPWAQRMMQIQVAIIYFFAFYGKLLGDRYMDGSAMYYMLGRLDIHVRGLERLMNHPAVYVVMTLLAVAMEVPLPLLLWFRRTRPWAALTGVALHAWIMAFMVIPVFGVVMLTSYVVYFSEEELDAVLERLRSRASRRRARLAVDPASAWGRLLPILDVLGRLEIGPAEPGALRLTTPAGRTREGAAALLWILPRLGAVFWALPALYLPRRAAPAAAQNPNR